MLNFIFSTLNTVLFGQAPPKPQQNHHLVKSHKFINGRIRTFKTRIRIGEKPGSIRIRIRTLCNVHCAQGIIDPAENEMRFLSWIKKSPPLWQTLQHESHDLLYPHPVDLLQESLSDGDDRLRSVSNSRYQKYNYKITNIKYIP